MPDTDATAATARRGGRGLLWAGLLIAWVTIATAGIVVLAFHTVSPNLGGSATPATVPNFVPAPLATTPLAPVPVISVPSVPVVPPTATVPAKHPTRTHVAAHPATHVAAVHTVRTIRTVTTVTSGGTTASGPAGSTPQANTDPGTAVVVIPVTKNGGGGTPAKPVTPAGGHPVKVTGVGTTAGSGEPTTSPAVPPVLVPGTGNGNGNGSGTTGTGGDSNPTPAGSGGGTDPVTPPDDDDEGTGSSDGPCHHHHDDNGRHHGHGHAYGRDRRGCDDDSD